MMRRDSGLSQSERVETLEESLAPKPVNIRVFDSRECPFPVKIEEDQIAKRYAWFEVASAWFDRAAREAEKIYDRRQFYDFLPVEVCDFLCDPLFIKQSFDADIAAGTFTVAEYLTELAEATAWSERAGLPAPSNLIEAKP